MRLTFAEFKQKLAALRRPKGKLSQTALRKLRRMQKTRPRAACDSFRYRQKHQHEIAAKLKREQNERRTARKAEALV